MLTVDEIRAVPLFSSLSPEELERIAQTAADVRLSAGEFAVPEGGERALFAVISGKFEVVKLFDGVERTLGWRAPGTIFGEVPLALGSPYPAGYRAFEPSRVLRLDARAYYSLVAASPDVATKMGALARERLGGLQSINAEAPKPRVTMVGHQADGMCSELQRFLTRNQITFEWLSPNAPEMKAKWPGEQPADSALPVLRLADGTELSRPKPRELAKRLGLQTDARLAEYDTVIIGGGPAGLAAAVYGASEGLRTVLVEREAPGGQAGTSSRIENYLGFPNGISGDELASRALQQARRLGAEILVTRSITRIDPATREVFLDGNEVLRARTVVLASGVSWRRLAIEGLDRLIGKGVYYGASRSDASAVHGLDVYLIGSGNSAGQAAMNFADHARSVTLIIRGETIDKGMSIYLVEQLRRRSNIFAELQSEVQAVYGDTQLTAIDIRNHATKTVRRQECKELFVFIGADAETQWLPEGIARDARGYVLTGADVVEAGKWSQERDPHHLETSAPGIFACGDVRLGPVKRVAAAVGEGSMVIAFVQRFMRAP